MPPQKRKLHLNRFTRGQQRSIRSALEAGEPVHLLDEYGRTVAVVVAGDGHACPSQDHREEESAT